MNTHVHKQSLDSRFHSKFRRQTGLQPPQKRRMRTRHRSPRTRMRLLRTRDGCPPPRRMQVRIARTLHHASNLRMRWGCHASAHARSRRTRSRPDRHYDPKRGSVPRAARCTQQRPVHPAAVCCSSLRCPPRENPLASRALTGQLGWARAKQTPRNNRGTWPRLLDLDASAGAVARNRKEPWADRRWGPIPAHWRVSSYKP
jgi:hypothetical protein